MQHTSTNTAQIAVGVAAGRPTFQATLSRLESVQSTLTVGQKAQKRFDDSKGTFDITLGVDREVDTKLSVVNPVRFALLLRLEEERQPMKLKLMLEVTYRRRYRWRNKTLSRRHV